jgi:hypothetical protein
VACNQGDIRNLDIKPIKENNIDFPNIKITPEINDYVLKFKSGEDLLRSGGIPTDLLDNAAFGFNNDNLKQIMLNKLSIKWHDDLKNVLFEIKKSGLNPKEWASKINLNEPIDVSYEKNKFFIEDGHHRYYAAKILNKPLNINLEIKTNPITKLGGDLGYD